MILGDWGGTEAGAKAKPVDYSYLKIYDDGSWELKKRKNATDLAFEVVLPPEDTDFALSTIQEVLSVPAAWIATDASGFDGLNVFGLGTADLEYAKTLGRASISVKGLI